MRLVIPMAPMGKSRPRVTSSGAFMPKPYRDWKKEFGLHAAAQARGESFPDTFAIHLTVATKSGKMRSDLDNVVGACLDALQDCGVIANDRGCRAITAVLVKSKTPGMTIILGAMEVAA